MKDSRKDGGLTPVGDILAKSKVIKQAAAITPHVIKLLDAAQEISNAPDEAEKAFMARQLVQCTLPHANPGNVPVWVRTNGNFTLSLQQGYKAGKAIGYPYGSIPRLLLFWITTEALRNRARFERAECDNPRHLELGKSLSAFMREIGLDPNTGRGKRGDGKRLREQMRRLFRCHISFDVVIDVAHQHGEKWSDMAVAPEGELWWDPKSPLQDDLWGSWIELGEKFFQAIIASPVPVDMRALRALKRSPLALDLYAWASYRAFGITKKGKAQFIPWAGLMTQLGTDYAQRKDFKRYAKAALRKVQAVYPGLVLTYERGGITIHPSSLAVAQRQTKQVGN